jgi:uncharacterized protein (DUF488 family)
VIATVGHGARSAAELVSILQAAQIRTRRRARSPHGRSSSALMCAEGNPADCHRSHIADWLVAHGHKVVHLLAPGRTVEHAVHPQEELWRDV